MRYLSFHNITWALNQVVRLNDQASSDHLASELAHLYFPSTRFVHSSIPSAYSPVTAPVTLITKTTPEDSTAHAFLVSQTAESQSFAETIQNIVESNAMFDFIENFGFGNAIYIIIIRGVHIGIYEFVNFGSNFDNVSISNFEGLKALHEIIPYSQFMAFNDYESNGQDYLQYLLSKNALNFALNTGAQHLRSIGVESTSNIESPHIWNLLNAEHADYVHNLFQTAGNNFATSYLF